MLDVNSRRIMYSVLDVMDVDWVRASRQQASLICLFNQTLDCAKLLARWSFRQKIQATTLRNVHKLIVCMYVSLWSYRWMVDRGSVGDWIIDPSWTDQEQIIRLNKTPNRWSGDLVSVCGHFASLFSGLIGCLGLGDLFSHFCTNTAILTRSI